MLGWFRRHATILMVVLGSAAMVIFGLGSVFDSFARSASEKVRENPAVATWAGGELTRDNVMGVYQNHGESVRFLKAVVEAAETKSGDRVTPLADMVSPIEDDNREVVMGSVLQRLILAKAAEDQGFMVGDGMVDEYIALISGAAQFSEADLRKINRSVNSTSLDVVKEHLKVELKAMQMNRLSVVGMSLPPNPTEAISLYGRTAERIECEVIPVAVSDFVDKVTAEPSDSELRELFKEGKNDLPDFTGEKPGFKLGRKINVQYFVANAERFLQTEMNAITDEQVQKEYDRLVEKNHVLVVEPVVKDNSFVIPGLDSLDMPEEGDSDSGNADDAPAVPNDDAPALPGDDAPAPPSGDAPVMTEPASDSAPTVETPVSPATEVVPSTEVVPGTEVPVVPEGASYQIGKTRAQFVSVQEVPEQAVGEVVQAVTEPAVVTDQAQTEPAVVTDQVVTEPAAATEQAATPPASEPQTGSIGSDIEEEVKKQEAAPERKYKPLIDVAESIRRSLASPIANKKMSLAIESVNYELEDYFSDLEIAEADDSEPEPDKPDFEQMAKQFNLELKETGLVDRDAMKQDPLGSIEVGVDVFGNYLFFMAGEKKLYEGTPFGGASAIVPDYYLFWYIENEKPRVGDFEECKEQVVKFWKKREALKLAKEEAESISKKVNDVRKSKMSELYPERALTTGQFSWFDTVRGGILSRPGNVDRPSDEFMATAFSLVELEAGVAVDSNRENVYVIQSISGSRPISELGDDFLQNRLMRFKRVPSEVRRAAAYYGRQEGRKAELEMRESLGFELDSEFMN